MSFVDSWSNIPVELLVKVFAYLLTDAKGVRDVCRCAEVCRNWGNIPWHGTADLSLAGRSKSATDSLLERLSKTKLSRITGLNLSGWRNLTLAGLRSVTEHCEQLEYINISSGSRWVLDLENTYIITPEAYVSNLKQKFVAQISQIKALKRVDFSNVLNFGNSNQAFVELVKKCAGNLTHLNLSGMDSIRASLVLNICKYCPNLQVLNLSHTFIEHISFEEIQNSCSKLKELYLANLTLRVKRGKKNDLLRGFPNLQVLDVDNKKECSWLTEDLLDTILKTSCELKSLSVAGVSYFSEEVFDIPTLKMHTLGLAHRKIIYSVVEKICDKWSETLHDLDLSWTECSGGFDEMIMHIAGSLKKLEELNLRGTSVGDDAVKVLLTGCGDLRSLDLTSCRGIKRGMKKLHSGKDEIEVVRKSYSK